MQEANDRYIWIAAIIDSSDDAIISKDLANIIVSWNKGAEKLYGYAAEEVIGKPIAIIIPEDKKTDISMTAELIENRTYIDHLETVRIAKDGRRIDVSVSVSPIIDASGVLIGSSAIARDITERKAAELKLRSSEDRYRKIVELSPDTILIQQDSKLVFINQAGVKLFAAQNVDELIGESIWKLFTADRHGIIRAHIQSMKAMEQAVTNIEYAIIRLDGKIIPVETSSCPVLYDDKFAVYTIMRDISERKKTNVYLNLQYQTANILSTTENMTDGLNHTLKAICVLLHFDIARIWYGYNPDSGLNRIANWVREGIPAVTVNGLADIVWNSKEPVWADLTLPAYGQLVEDSDFKLALGIPIFNEQEYIGMLELLNTHYISSDNSMLECLRNIAFQIGTFVKAKYSENEVIFLSKHDLLTGLPNRVFFQEALTFELYRAKNKNTRLAVMFLDVEDFSSINEAFEQHFADNVLNLIAKELKCLMKSSDYVARINGDQFAIMLDEFTCIEQVYELLEQLKLNLQTKFSNSDINVNIQFNIGISLYPEDGNNTDTIMKNASIALTKAKKIGNGAVQLCSSDMTNRAKHRIDLENDLRNALQNNEFVLYYQPIVDTISMQTTAFEALVRWRNHGMIVPPNEFISILEDTQLIVPVGEWILNSACVQCKSWQEILNYPLTISVNISPVQFKHSNVLANISEALNNSGLDPTCLKIEITESAIMGDLQKNIKLLTKIKDLGVIIAIDDFGTGYSSLNYLRQLPIDYLKIDRSFVVNMQDNLNDAAIVRTIINLADNLGYKVIAEGIETEAQLLALTSMGCNEIQGYFFARPMPADEAQAFLLGPGLV